MPDVFEIIFFRGTRTELASLATNNNKHNAIVCIRYNPFSLYIHLEVNFLVKGEFIVGLIFSFLRCLKRRRVVVGIFPLYGRRATQLILMIKVGKVKVW